MARGRESEEEDKKKPRAAADCGGGWFEGLRASGCILSGARACEGCGRPREPP